MSGAKESSPYLTNTASPATFLMFARDLAHFPGNAIILMMVFWSFCDFVEKLAPPGVGCPGRLLGDGYLSIYHPSIYLYLSLYLSISPSIYLSIYLSIHLSLHLSLYLYLFLYLLISLRVSLYLTGLFLHALLLGYMYGLSV